MLSESILSVPFSSYFDKPSYYWVRQWKVTMEPWMQMHHSLGCLCWMFSLPLIRMLQQILNEFIANVGEYQSQVISMPLNFSLVWFVDYSQTWWSSTWRLKYHMSQKHRWALATQVLYTIQNADSWTCCHTWLLCSSFLCNRKSWEDLISPPTLTACSAAPKWQKYIHTALRFQVISLCAYW